MHKPVFTALTPTGPFFPAIIALHGFMALALGNGTAGGMYYQCRLKSEFAGYANITQLINRDIQRDAYGMHDSTGGEYVLDGVEFYNQSSARVLGIEGREDSCELSDGPGAAVGLTYITINDQFRDYFRFKPDGHDSIRITIERIDWS
jgi:hypothetical protein